ncbi:hypothetical protein [Streptomyces silvensis]|uniref:DUF4913 domain-containing protein n=1 Tax=Streptomyces silvensis TaxID=1765722 RepID=A0A0W7XBJ7_9ACTN|nr:hypothetical protein [Streptomyces silvensis]KUF20144.1 hypothetical protein AT728_40185 [Streptomyces silvensis]
MADTEATEATEPASTPAAPAGEKKPPPPQRWVWSDMDLDEREARLGEMTLWVDWLIKTYDIRNQVARCWYRHPRIVEHLTALYTGWFRTYAGDPTKLGLRSEAEWIKDLYAFLPRLNSASCQTSHMETPAPTLTADDKAFSEWLDEPPTFFAAERFHPAKAQKLRMAEEAKAAAEVRAARKESEEKKES